MGKTKVQKIGFLVGVVAMLIIGYGPAIEGLTLVGQRVLACTVLMVIFWITEAMPIPFTALLPIFLFPVNFICCVRSHLGCCSAVQSVCFPENVMHLVN